MKGFWQRDGRRGNYLIHEPLMRYWWFFTAFVALFAPIGILDLVPQLGVLTNTISAIFPTISNYSARSDFPQVTMLYMTITWITSPLHGYFLWKEYYSGSSEWVAGFNNPDSWTAGQRIKGIVTIFLIIPIVIYLGFYNVGHDFNLLPINSSRYALAIAGWFFAGGGAVLLLVFAFIQLRLLLSLHWTSH